MGRWLVIVSGIISGGCQSQALPTVSTEWGKGFAAATLGYGGQTIANTPDGGDVCRCSGSGVVVQPDGHRTDCPCGGPGMCHCEGSGAVGSSGESLNEVQWVRRLAVDLNCDPERGVEVRLATGTRVDLVNDKYAIEADWGYKWAEGCGQALYYSACTGKDAGLLLLLKSSKDRRYVERATVVTARHGIALWVYDTSKDRWEHMHAREGDAQWKDKTGNIAESRWTNGRQRGWLLRRARKRLTESEN